MAGTGCAGGLTGVGSIAAFAAGLTFFGDVRRAGASDAPSMAEHELLYLLEKLRVRDIMTQDVVTVRGTTSLAEAGQLFLQRKFGCLPVVGDDNRLEGIVTVTDLLHAYVKHHDPGRTV